jgi:hypothetical protein
MLTGGCSLIALTIIAVASRAKSFMTLAVRNESLEWFALLVVSRAISPLLIAFDMWYCHCVYKIRVGTPSLTVPLFVRRLIEYMAS